jgi:hypothetical protein
MLFLGSLCDEEEEMRGGEVAAARRARWWPAFARARAPAPPRRHETAVRIECGGGEEEAALAWARRVGPCRVEAALRSPAGCSAGAAGALEGAARALARGAGQALDAEEGEVVG